MEMMNIFTSKKFRNFILLAQTNNITEAAELAHMTSSPFGKSIADLEGLIGYQLFDRKHNSIRLNETGQHLYQKLLPVYQQLLAVNYEVCNHKKLVVGIDNMYPAFIYDQLCCLSDKYDDEGLFFKKMVFNDDFVINYLYSHQVNCILSPQNSSRINMMEDIDIINISPLRMGFLASREHHGTRLSELLNILPWLQMKFHNSSNLKSHLYQSIIDYYHVKPSLVYQPYNFMTGVDIVESGHYITVIPFFFMRLINAQRFVYFDLPVGEIFKEYIYSIKGNMKVQTLINQITHERKRYS